jgi:hypothetical protein
MANNEALSLQEGTLPQSETENTEKLKKQITEELLKITDISEEKLSVFIKSMETLDDKVLEDLITQLIKELEEQSLPLLSAMGRSPNTRVSLFAIENLGRIQSQKSVDILSQIAVEGQLDKKIRKAARTSLHRLHAVGLVVKKVVDPAIAKSRERKVKHKPYQAVMSNVDGAGSQLIILAREMFAGDLHILQAVINEQDGLKECHAKRGLTKKILARLIDTMPEVAREQDAPYTVLVKIDYNYGTRLIIEAEKRTESLGNPISQEYRSVKEIFLESADPTVQNPVYRELEAEKIKTQSYLLTRSADLVKHPLIEGWLFDSDKIEKYAEELEQQEETVLELSPQFVKEREDSVFDRALLELFDEKQRAFYKERLEKTAYILFIQEEIEEAKKALAAALALDLQAGVSIKNHPFITELTRRNITFYKESETDQLTEERIEEYYREREKVREQSSLIITDPRSVR